MYSGASHSRSRANARVERKPDWRRYQRRRSHAEAIYSAADLASVPYALTRRVFLLLVHAAGRRCAWHVRLLGGAMGHFGFPRALWSREQRKQMTRSASTQDVHAKTNARMHRKKSRNDTRSHLRSGNNPARPNASRPRATTPPRGAPDLPNEECDAFVAQ